MHSLVSKFQLRDIHIWPSGWQATHVYCYQACNTYYNNTILCEFSWRSPVVFLQSCCVIIVFFVCCVSLQSEIFTMHLYLSCSKLFIVSKLQRMQSIRRVKLPTHCDLGMKNSNRKMSESMQLFSCICLIFHRLSTCTFILLTFSLLCTY